MHSSISVRPGLTNLCRGSEYPAPPADTGRSSYRISAVTGYAKPALELPKQKGGFNSVLHQSADGQIEHLSKVTDRLSKN